LESTDRGAAELPGKGVGVAHVSSAEVPADEQLTVAFNGRVTVGVTSPFWIVVRPANLATLFAQHKTPQFVSLDVLNRHALNSDGHSKKIEYHEAALAMFFAYYNFCRVHSTLKATPAVAAGLTDHTWNVGELLMAAAA
jgi:hypothetical protein